LNKKKNISAQLSVVRGGLQKEISYGSLRIVAATENHSPFSVEAVAFEEDTWLIMSADPKVCEPGEHPIRLMTDLINTASIPIGSVLVKNGKPLKFLAVVHDVDQDPTWREAWIEKALLGIFREAEHRRLEAIAMPLLGTLHGRLQPTRFIHLLDRSLKQSPLKHLRRLWLITPPHINRDIVNRLNSEGV
jgi:hypothetical protein